MIEFGDLDHGEIIANAAGLTLNSRVDICISQVKNDELVGGVIFRDYTGSSIGLHVAGFNPRWLTRDFLWVTFDYAFTQLKCKKIFSPIPQNNLRSIEFCQKIGFKLDTIIRDVYPIGDMLVFSLYKDECRWLDVKPRWIKAGESTDGQY